MIQVERPRLQAIAEFPTVYNGVHESIYRANAILNLVDDWLTKEVPSAILLETIRALRSWGDDKKFEVKSET